MPYVYAAMWVAAGLILIFRMSRENRVFYALGAFFLLLGGWWFADAALAVNPFSGAWGWALRGLTAAALALACAVYYRESRKNRGDAPGDDPSGRDGK
ncbi:hypothetical protein [Caproiciproducens sp. CPB-2]|uniref:hypothetical protein n=1 Tax=Caproiciproducens sp. CPB-2 TaxID=3030017 RepID=UPI0023DAC477|nr:hypothetical protein [Caproiciproducens sp. CPB-2]MDF1494471.1 hypothetical protein [Caproiciproducens sp. CPB-2]